MKAKRHILKSRVALAAMAVGCALFAACLTAYSLMLPAQDARTSDRNYGYVYSGTKSASAAFTTENDAQDSMLVFGSSELSTPSSVASQVPAVVFGEGNTGLDLTYIGEANDQSLWHAIAAGAYSQYESNRKVVFIVSLGWFVDGGVSDEVFGMRFSYSLYREFCDNPNISESSKAYVKKRLAEQGIDEAKINAGLREQPLDYLNDAAFSAMDDLKLRQDLMSVRELGVDTSWREGVQSEEPDFDALREEALAEAKSKSSNSLHINDDFYTANLEGNMERLKNSKASETYSNTPEYEDLSFCLKIFQEVGFEPLVIISPVHGEFFDYEGITQETRQRAYNNISRICEEHGVATVDCSSKEYEDYYLFDIVHYGGPGWVDLEEKIYDYATK